jgi:hypothetical protein
MPGIFLSIYIGLGILAILFAQIFNKTLRKVFSAFFLYRLPMAFCCYLLGRGYSEIIEIFNFQKRKASSFCGQFDYIDNETKVSSWESSRRELALSFR